MCANTQPIPAVPVHMPSPETIRGALKTLGWTRAQAAANLGVSLDTVHQWCAPVSNAKHRSISGPALRILTWALARGGLPDDWPAPCEEPIGEVIRGFVEAPAQRGEGE